jgi:membrane-associated protein
MAQIDIIQPYITEFSYLGILIWFLFLSHFAPIFEEVVLLSIGYLSALGIMHPVIAIAISILSLLIADNTFYFLALYENKYIKKIKNRLRKGRLGKRFNYNERNLLQAIFTFTFIPKIRFFGPVIAGTRKIPWKKFFIIDLSALTTYVILYVMLGFFFYNLFVNIFEKIRVHFIFIIFVVITLLIFIYWFKHYLRGRK